MEGHNLNGHHGSGNGYQCILDDIMSINSFGVENFDTPCIVGECVKYKLISGLFVFNQSLV